MCDLSDWADECISIVKDNVQDNHQNYIVNCLERSGKPTTTKPTYYMYGSLKGQVMSLSCGNCGHILGEPFWKYCPNCGRKLPTGWSETWRYKKKKRAKDE